VRRNRAVLRELFFKARIYNEIMARGWESKSVEEQQNEVRNSGLANKPAIGAEAGRRASAIESLKLQRARVARELEESENPRFLELKRKELEHLDAELAKLGGE
jgi:hypothetical protein